MNSSRRSSPFAELTVRACAAVSVVLVILPRSAPPLMVTRWAVTPSTVALARPRFRTVNALPVMLPATLQVNSPAKVESLMETVEPSLRVM